MRFYHFTILIFLSVTIFILQFLNGASAEDVFSRPNVFSKPGASAAIPSPAPPTYIVLPGPVATEVKKNDPNMPREVFLDAGPAASELRDRHPTAADEDDEERYPPPKKKKHAPKLRDEDRADEFQDVN